MSTETTTTNAPATTKAGLPSRRQRTEWFSPRSVPSDSWNVTVGQTPEGAQKLGDQIQAASRRLERDGGQYAASSVQGRRVLKLLEAANYLSAAAQLGPDDDMGRYARRLAQQVRTYVGHLVPVPEASDIRPEVPGV
ncbi:hypothetical protein O7626_39790 [Micromonospora sp. WMMD1102]|uniref:hypothetical protein n=1 Tax=Micromonospora sp. WMMD1102 TaxID=3016105 RepID=UPI002415419E|nr:hypothetical protein [Micromonospora sp. WMMD1102]MDG4791958.1 hypothetical protein [Micromonospora sp. WMMD1102]